MADTPPLRRDPTQAVRIGVPMTPLSDLYYELIRRRWPFLLGVLTAAYLGVNVIFALLYMLDPVGLGGSASSGFGSAFSFSVQTFATIGYGAIAPQTTYANVLVTLEALSGIIFTAIATGLVFAKFSRPSARILFSTPMVVTQRHGKPCLQFRVANARGNELVEAAIHVSVLMTESSPEGHSLRRLHDLALERSTSSLFALSWLVMHVIDESSPLSGHDAASLAADEALIIVTLTGIDGTFAQSVHARHLYEFHDIRWNHRFVDVVSPHAPRRVQLDLTRFHDVEPEQLTG
ncbi:MAG TPA: ion channel [Nannocystaceae bacterium]|nr:ion channel [Nannocystaceae bacterium]